jgi:hypothetical protein
MHSVREGLEFLVLYQVLTHTHCGTHKPPFLWREWVPLYLDRTCKQLSKQQIQDDPSLPNDFPRRVECRAIHLLPLSAASCQPSDLPLDAIKQQNVWPWCLEALCVLGSVAACSTPVYTSNPAKHKKPHAKNTTIIIIKLCICKNAWPVFCLHTEVCVCTSLVDVEMWASGHVCNIIGMYCSGMQWSLCLCPDSESSFGLP